MVEVKIPTEGVEILDDIRSDDLWFIRRIGSEENRLLSMDDGTETRLIAFRTQEDADAFIVANNLAGVEPFFKKKETKQ